MIAGRSDDTTSAAAVTARRAIESREPFGEWPIPEVEITFTCTGCGAKEAISVPWSEHHDIPTGWLSRDACGSLTLPRRVDHIFACSSACADVLDERFPPAPKPKWFTSS